MEVNRALFDSSVSQSSEIQFLKVISVVMFAAYLKRVKSQWSDDILALSVVRTDVNDATFLEFLLTVSKQFLYFPKKTQLLFREWD